MRNRYQQVLKAFFCHRLFHTRVNILSITQEEMAHRLSMSCRSYVDLEHGETSCSAVTLAIFLVFDCTDPYEFLEELRYAFDEVSTAATV